MEHYFLNKRVLYSKIRCRNKTVKCECNDVHFLVCYWADGTATPLEISFFVQNCLVRVLKPCHLASKTTTLRSNLLRRQLHCKQSILLFNSNCHKYVDFTIQLLPHKHWSFKILLKYLNCNEGRIKLTLVTNTQINLKLQP